MDQNRIMIYHNGFVSHVNTDVSVNESHR